MSYATLHFDVPSRASRGANLPGYFSSAERGGALLAQIIVCLTTLAWTALGGTSGRYVVYTLPVTMMLPWLIGSRGNPKLNVNVVVAIAIYAAMTLFSLALNGANEFTQRDVIIISSILILFALVGVQPPWSAAFAMGTMFLALCIQAATQGINLAIDFVDSDGVLESGFAMPLGIVVLFYYRTKRLLYGLLAALLCFIAFKRIVLLGIVGAVAFDFACSRFKWSETVQFRLAIVLAVLITALSLGMQQIFVLLQNLVQQEDFSANRISLGRYDFANVAWAQWATAGELNYIFGFGPGATDVALNRIWPGTLLHNDWLKLLTDYGIFGLVGFHLIMIQIFRGHPLGPMFYLYSVVVMTTDNILIYIFHYIFVSQLMQIPIAPRERSG